MAARPTPEQKAADNLAMAREKMDSWPAPYPEVARQLHDAVMAVDDGLQARLWYGGVGYARSHSEPVLLFYRVDEDLLSIGVTERSSIAADGPSQLAEAAWYLHAEHAPVTDATVEHVQTIARRALDQ
jgi:hypothetical protein